MLTRYRVISRVSSIRVATESRMDRVDAVPICVWAPRLRNKAAKGASNGGALAVSPPSRSAAKFSIHRTE